jgi:hypothetical protein
MKTLPSGTRTSPSWPIAAFNKLGGVLRILGLHPKVDERRLFDALEAQDQWQGPLADWVRQARRVRLKSYDTDASLTLFGTLAIRAQMQQCYRNVIDFEHLIAKDPSILDERIEKPLFVLGWPRTGTTMMQRLLCLHKEARYTPVWEGYTPLPADAEGRAIPLEKRREKARRALQLLYWISPAFKAIHPMEVDDPEECYQLFRNYSAMPHGWDFAYLPTYWEWFDKEATLHAYEIHKRQLQLLQRLDRRGHWVLKSPQHVAGLPGLLKVYPDARIVFTHRDPVEAVASYCSLVAVAWSMTSGNVSTRKITGYVLSTAARSQAIARDTLKTLPADQIVHVEYEDMMRDAPSTATRIYEKFGYTADPDLAFKMQAWLTANPKNRHGRHAYNLADFGLTEADVKRELA